jgi:hypothetical protein
MGKEKPPLTVEVAKSDLRALIFWAEWGICRARSGSYAWLENELPHISKTYLGKSCSRPKFGKYCGRMKSNV